jgi:hypothetical protein
VSRFAYDFTLVCLPIVQILFDGAFDFLPWNKLPLWLFVFLPNEIKMFFLPLLP